MKKVLTAAVAALTITTAVAASTSNADAKGFKFGGWGWKPYYGYGIAAGVLGAAALGAYATTCERVPVFNRFGEYVGSRRVCSPYY